MNIKYRIVRQLTDIKEYLIDNNFLFYRTKEAIIKYNLSSDEHEWETKVGAYGYLKEINKELISCTDFDLNTVLVNKVDGALNPFKGQFVFLYVCPQNDYVLTYEFNGLNKTLTKRKRNDIKNVMWTTSFDPDFTGAGIIDNNECFNSTKRNKGIFAFDINGGKNLWKIYLKDLDIKSERSRDDLQVEKILGKYNGELWVAISGKVIVLNAATGNLNFVLEAVGSIYDQDVSIKGLVFSSYGHIDRNRGLLYVVQSQSFLEYDLTNRKVIRFVNLTQIIEKAGISYVKNVFLNDDLIYFTGNTTSFPKENRMLGILDRVSLEILWHTEIEAPEKGFIPLGELPKISEDKLFIKDYSGILHVYQKE